MSWVIIYIIVSFVAFVIGIVGYSLAAAADQEQRYSETTDLILSIIFGTVMAITWLSITHMIRRFML